MRCFSPASFLATQVGPSDWIRTSGLLNPIQARYQTSPHPERTVFLTRQLRYNTMPWRKKQALFLIFSFVFQEQKRAAFRPPKCLFLFLRKDADKSRCDCDPYCHNDLFSYALATAWSSDQMDQRKPATKRTASTGIASSTEETSSWGKIWSRNMGRTQIPQMIQPPLPPNR